MDLKRLKQVDHELKVLAKRYPPQAWDVPVEVRFQARPALWSIGPEVEFQMTVMEGAGGFAYPMDPRQMRKEFLGLKLSTRTLLAFLNRYGVWSDAQRYGLEEFVEDQDFFNRILTSPPKARERALSVLQLRKRLLRGGAQYSSEFEFRKGVPMLVVATSACLDAIWLSIEIDLSRGTVFKRCARSDCGVLFEITSGHNRMYHTQYCGHLTSVRRKAEEKRKLSAAKRAKNH